MSMSYNMANCLLEMVGPLIVFLAGGSDVTNIFFFSLMFTGTPIIYYRGMEKTKKDDDREAKSKIRIFKRKVEPKQEEANSDVRLFEKKRINDCSPPNPVSAMQDVEIIDIDNENKM